MATGIFGLKTVYKKQYQNVKNNNFASWPESATYGYYGGGLYDPSSFWYGIPRLDFTNSTVSFPSNYLPASLRGIASASSNFYGYFGGGATGPFFSSTYLSTITRLDFSTENLSDPGKNMPITRIYHTGFSNSN